jgi:NAD(P)-dependent dehydrogenase (short-subunit alcohol dehydrogenase family)
VSAAVVTGGGSGIGKEVVRRLLKSDRECACAVLDVRPEGANDVRDEFGAERVLLVDCDVADDASVAAAVKKVADWRSPIRSLVTSAGTTVKCASLDLSFRDWRLVQGVLIDGTFLVCREVGRRMAANGGGAIVNVASVSMFFGWPERLPYAAAKAAVGSLTKTLAVEWAAHGIRVNAVAPGYIETPFVARVVAEGFIDAGAARSLHAMGRFGSPSEAASAICFLLSEQASFITGEILTVDGGFTAKKLP